MDNIKSSFIMNLLFISSNVGIYIILSEKTSNMLKNVKIKVDFPIPVGYDLYNLINNSMTRKSSYVYLIYRELTIAESQR